MYITQIKANIQKRSQFNGEMNLTYYKDSTGEYKLSFAVNKAGKQLSVAETMNVNNPKATFNGTNNANKSLQQVKKAGIRTSLDESDNVMNEVIEHSKVYEIICDLINKKFSEKWDSKKDKNKMGLTPDEIKFSQEYQADLKKVRSSKNKFDTYYKNHRKAIDTDRKKFAKKYNIGERKLKREEEKNYLIKKYNIDDLVNDIWDN